MILIALGATACSMAQLNVTSRMSDLNYQWLMGYAGDVYQGNNTFNDGSLLASDTESFLVNETRTGFYPPTSHSWSASVDMEAMHSYSIAGPLSNASGISGSGRTRSVSAESGATAQSFITNPGNRLMLSFDVAANTPYTMTYQIYNAVSSEAPGEIAIQRWDGAFWLYVNSSAFFPPSNGVNTWTGTFSAGSYRVFMQTGANNFSNESNDAISSFSLTAVPEPGTMAALGLGTAAMLRRRRRKA